MAGAFQKNAFQNTAFQTEAAAAGVTLDLAVTEGADLLASSLSLNVALALSATDGADFASASVALNIVASLSATEGADVLAGEIALSAGTATLSLAATEGADLLNAGIDHDGKPEVVFSGGGGLGAYLSHKKKREAIERRLKELRKVLEEEDEKPIGVQYHQTELGFTPFEQKIQVFTVPEQRMEVNTAAPKSKPKKVATKIVEPPKPIRFRPIVVEKPRPVEPPPPPPKKKWDYEKLIKMMELMEAM